MGRKPKENRFMRVPEVAKRFGVSSPTVRTWIEEGRLRAIDVGAAKRVEYRISEKDVEIFMRTARRRVIRIVEKEAAFREKHPKRKVGRPRKTEAKAAAKAAAKDETNKSE